MGRRERALTTEQSPDLALQERKPVADDVPYDVHVHAEVPVNQDVAQAGDFFQSIVVGWLRISSWASSR
jgi:hypothetical protein